MMVHSGYPELYLPLINKIESACSNFLVEEIEQEKIDNLIKQYHWKIDDSEQENIESKETETDVNNDVKSEKSVVLDSGTQKVAPQFKYKGFINMGNTCYMNSFLQAIFMTTTFRSCLINEFAAKMPSMVSKTSSKIGIEQL